MSFLLDESRESLKREKAKQIHGRIIVQNTPMKTGLFIGVFSYARKIKFNRTKRREFF